MTKSPEGITLKIISPDLAQVYWSNGKYIGDMVKDVDGYYGFWFESNRGSWPSYALRLIASKLDELNADWDAQVQEYFAEEAAETFTPKSLDQYPAF